NPRSASQRRACGVSSRSTFFSFSCTRSSSICLSTIRSTTSMGRLENAIHPSRRLRNSGLKVRSRAFFASPPAPESRAKEATFTPPFVEVDGGDCLADLRAGAHEAARPRSEAHARGGHVPGAGVGGEDQDDVAEVA